MKKSFAIRLIAFVIAGCNAFCLTGCMALGMHEARKIIRKAEGGLTSLVGRPEAEAFKVLGYPDGKQEFGGDTVYVWGNNQTTIGYANTTPIYGTTKTTQAIPMNSDCTIKVIVSSGLVKNWDFKGDWGVCSPYRGRLIRYFNQENPE